MTATIKDVARAAGVHASTVSRAFSAPHMISAATLDRVLAAAADLDYRPNPAARALTTRRTGNIGVIVSDIANPFFPPLVKAAQAEARRHGHHVFVADTDEDPAVEEELVRSLAKQVDGVLLCAPRMSDEAIGRLSADVPLILVNRPLPGVPAVLMDAARGVREAVGHLVGLGHRDLALLAGPAASWTGRQAAAAARAAAAASGARLSVIGPERTRDDVGAVLADGGATGVLAYNDLQALALLERLRGRGVSVPGDLSVVGVDDIASAAMAHPRLTTVAMPTAAAGRAAVDLLLRTLDTRESRKPSPVVLDTRLVVRESTAPPPVPPRRS